MAFVSRNKNKESNNTKEYKVNQISLSTRQKEKLIQIVKSLLPESDISIGFISNSVNPMYGFVNIDGHFIHWYELCVNHLPNLISLKSSNDYNEIIKALNEVIIKKEDIIEFYYKNFISK